MHDGDRENVKEKHHAEPSYKESAEPSMHCTHEHKGGVDECLFADIKSLPDEVYRKLTARLARFAERLGAAHDQCEDLAQEAWLHAFAHSKQFRTELTTDRLFSWLAVIVHNLEMDALDRPERKLVLSLNALAVEPMDPKEASRGTREADIECLFALLERLQREEPENWRLLCEHRLEQRSVQELAEESGRTENSISCRIHRGMEKMRSWVCED